MLPRCTGNNGGRPLRIKHPLLHHSRFHSSSNLIVLLTDDAAAAPGATRSFEVNKLWKKFCRTSCCVCPLVGVGPRDDDDAGNAVGDVGGSPSGGDVATADNIVGGCLPVALPDTLRVGSTPAIAPTPPAPAPPTTPLPPPSISDKARSMLGRLKLLLHIGPTIPAAAPKSIGLRNAPRRSVQFLCVFVIIL
jgi:hypothetical protein